ncbi:MAG TPA: DUF1491 family protein [Croceibacterium sp.]|nr:DUF1491 family protein [Croceibacterium sp.]
MQARLPAHIEVSGLIRAVDAAGGFATVIAKGEREAGTILVVCFEKGRPTRAFERMPRPDGSRAWTLSRTQDSENPQEFDDYLARRAKQDDDLWIVELDIADAERFIGLTGTDD